MEDFDISKPEHGEFAPFYQTYINKVPDGPFLELLRRQGNDLTSDLEALPRERWDYRYQSDKWSIRQVVQHIIDTERVMAYRLLRVSRGDATPLPSFDQNDLLEGIVVKNRRALDILEEFKALRESNIYLISSIEPKAWLRVGHASHAPISARALAYIIAGHAIHHHIILKEKYLP